MWTKLHNVHITEPQFSNEDISDLFQGFCIPLNFQEWTGIITRNQVIIYEKDFQSLAGCKRSISCQLIKRINGDG